MRAVLDALGASRVLDQATPYSLAVNVPYAVAFAAVAAEVAWLARTPGEGRARISRSAAAAATMALGALAVGVLYTGVFRFLWGAVGQMRWEAAADFWRAHPVAGALAAFVAWDLSGWVYHLAGHRTRIGWAAHQVHHSGPDYDATLGLRQTWAPFHGLLHHPLLALAGFDFRVVVVCAAVSNCWQVLEHTSLPIRFPRLVEAVVMTPAAHRHHHGRDGGFVNVGPFFTVWDRLAGTWVPPGAPAPMAYGPARPAPANPLAVEAAGWVQLIRAWRASPRPVTREAAGQAETERSAAASGSSPSRGSTGSRPRSCRQMLNAATERLSHASPITQPPRTSLTKWTPRASRDRPMARTSAPTAIAAGTRHRRWTTGRNTTSSPP